MGFSGDGDWKWKMWTVRLGSFEMVKYRMWCFLVVAWFSLPIRFLSFSFSPFLLNVVAIRDCLPRSLPSPTCDKYRLRFLKISVLNPPLFPSSTVFYYGRLFLYQHVSGKILMEKEVGKYQWSL